MTHKDRLGASVRVALLEKIALLIGVAQARQDFDLILIHGAGAAGHQLAKQYQLSSGTLGDEQKFTGALLTCAANQRLNNTLFEIFASRGVRIFPVHTASTIIQKNKAIAYCDMHLIRAALQRNCWPMLYGEMVFDEELEMSICSGDAISAFLARELGAQKIFFASDIDGIFNKDPHLHKDAKLIKKTSLSELLNSADIKMTGSHNVDVTGGLCGKIKSFNLGKENSLQAVEIFNGLQEENYENIFLGKEFSHTIIEIKK